MEYKKVHTETQRRRGLPHNLIARPNIIFIISEIRKKMRVVISCLTAPDPLRPCASARVLFLLLALCGPVPLCELLICFLCMYFIILYNEHHEKNHS